MEKNRIRATATLLNKAISKVITFFWSKWRGRVMLWRGGGGVVVLQGPCCCWERWWADGRRGARRREDGSAGQGWPWRVVIWTIQIKYINYLPDIQTCKYRTNGLINYKDTKAKCRHPKILTSKGTLRQVYCISEFIRLERYSQSC